MTPYGNKTQAINDNYVTPKHAWEYVTQYIGNQKVWDPFYLNGQHTLRDCGFDIVHENTDFFTTEIPDGVDIIVTNPPFSKTKECLTKMKMTGLPFMCILPMQKLNTKYFAELFKDDDQMQFIIPLKRIHFGIVTDDGSINYASKKTNFDCMFYCYKINLPKTIQWV